MTPAPFPPESIPPEVVTLCRRLGQAGHVAYVVGGAVRDLLRSPARAAAKDFDIATSALPEEVVRIFGAKRTIPTGIAHGTVTVLCDSTGSDGKPRPVEVTTFRGETGYSDGRRPDHVEFITDLVEDLRRRDFTINAIAYDPLAQRLHDPFDGQGDLSRQTIRAVGDAAQRFAEDGLRLLRGVRFAAQLGFAIDAPTRAAFLGALPTLRKVSRERIRDELLKLLSAPQPSLGLVHLLEPTSDGWDAQRGLLGVVLPELAEALAAEPAAAERWLQHVDRVPAATRLAALLWPLRRTELASWNARRYTDRLDELLKLPTQQRQHLAALLAFPSPDHAPDAPWSPPRLRRFLAEYPPQLSDDFFTLELAELELLGADAANRHLALTQLRERCAAERAQNPPLHASDLAVTGKVLMATLGIQPGPTIGILLRHLLDHVLDDPARNEREALLAEAARFVTSSPTTEP